jgi:2-isopropylmalate synthase
VRIEEESITVLGQGSDLDTLVASAKAYINAINKLIVKRDKLKDAKSKIFESNEKVDKHVI